MASTLEIQKALLGQGFDPGPIDGLPGRRTTAALSEFQRAKGLPVTGVVDASTAIKLLGNDAAAGAPTPPWIELALTKKGLNEERNKSTLMAFLKLGKGTIGDPARTPWCGDFVETCMAVTLPGEPTLANPYAAINWLQFGMATSPRVGGILVFHRGDPSSWEGHVGFYVGEDATHYHVLGGNQGNSVSVSRIAKTRLRDNGSRWPKTYPQNTARRYADPANIDVTTNEV